MSHDYKLNDKVLATQNLRLGLKFIAVGTEGTVTAFGRYSDDPIVTFTNGTEFICHVREIVRID